MIRFPIAVLLLLLSACDKYEGMSSADKKDLLKAEAEAGNAKSLAEAEKIKAEAEEIKARAAAIASGRAPVSREEYLSLLRRVEVLEAKGK